MRPLATSLVVALGAAPGAQAGPSPGAVEQGEVRAGGLEFQTRSAGPVDGPLVILLHGFPQTSRIFDPALAALAQRGYRAVAFDQRGYSPGARPETVLDYAMPQLVGDVLAVAEALGRQRFHLVGHDWGAAVAWIATAQHPNRVASLTALSTPHVSALALALGDPASDQSRRSAYMRVLAADGAEQRLLADDAAGLRGIYQRALDAAGRPVFDAEQIGAALEVLGDPAALRSALNWYRASSPLPAAGGSAAPPTPLPPVRVPTLYVWGDADLAFDRGPAEATAGFVEAAYRFEALEGVGHWLMEEAPERVIALLVEHLDAAGGAAEH